MKSEAVYCGSKKLVIIPQQGPAQPISRQEDRRLQVVQIKRDVTRESLSAFHYANSCRQLSSGSASRRARSHCQVFWAPGAGGPNMRCIHKTTLFPIFESLFTSHIDNGHNGLPDLTAIQKVEASDTIGTNSGSRKLRQGAGGSITGKL